MKKKNLIILLIIPFIISALTIATVNISYNAIDVDISNIKWDFLDIEALKVNELKELSAEGVNNRNYKVAAGNELVWTFKNKNSEDEEPLAEITKKGTRSYLKALKNGEIIVTCSNAKGTVSRSFTCILYNSGVIYLTPTIAQSSQGKVDQTNYYGQYNLVNGEKQSATFGIQMMAVPDSLVDTVAISVNGGAQVNFDYNNIKKTGSRAIVDGVVSIESHGNVEINITTSLVDQDLSLSGYSFYVVNNGVNVYSFNDLMQCTNYSAKGEIMVLQRSFVALSKSYADDETSFGIPKSEKTIDNSFVEYIETSYNHKFLDQWNKTTEEDKHFNASVCVALHVKKDIYGNGHLINFHNVAYPLQSINGIPTTTSSDLFQGPLPFYTVGNPKGSTGSDISNLNLVSAYGQDNIGMYVDGDNILINDVVVKNCDDVVSLSFLSTVGTVVEINGYNVELRNMRMSNGRQVLRSFSNFNLTLNNCRLSNARNFLFSTGANEYSTVRDTKIHTLPTPNSTVEATLESYLSDSGEGNTLLIDYLNGTFKTDRGAYKSTEDMKNALKKLQNALSDESVKGQFKGSTEIHDCQFYRSGISAIGLETLFNGPFLYSPESPNNIAPFFAMVNSLLVGTDFTPRRVSGTSYPVKVNLSGNTKFYDYKTLDELDVSGLISESISSLAKELGKNISFDEHIFPIKYFIAGFPYKFTYQGVAKVNIPIAYYGGGKNYSQVTTIGLNPETIKHINGATMDNPLSPDEVDLLRKYLDFPAISPNGGISLGGMFENLNVDHNTLIKTVTLVTGYEPFKFAFVTDGYLIGQDPSIEEMQQNALLLGGNV